MMWFAVAVHTRGTGVGVGVADVVVDRCDEFGDVAEGAAADALTGDLSEASLDQIQPR
jgi:hypothetical protein